MRCLFTVHSWPGVATKVLESQGIPGVIWVSILRALVFQMGLKV